MQLTQRQHVQYAVALMAGNAVRWMDSIQSTRPCSNNFPEFEKLFINQYAPLNDKNIARDKLCELWEYGSV